jgi:hypothetical protein
VALDEKMLRRPDWKPGVPVVLGDGQTWELRKPRVRWYPERADAKIKVLASGSHEFGPESDELLGVYFGDVESMTWDFPTARFELAIRLLEANYSVTNEHFRELLYFERDDPGNEEMWKSIGAIFAGSVPKPGPAT